MTLHDSIPRTPATDPIDQWAQKFRKCKSSGIDLLIDEFQLDVSSHDLADALCGWVTANTHPTVWAITPNEQRIFSLDLFTKEGSSVPAYSYDLIEVLEEGVFDTDWTERRNELITRLGDLKREIDRIIGKLRATDA